MRQNIHKFYLDIAKKYSERGTCPKLKVGAILVKNNRIISAGYNGAPSGFEHCEDVIPMCYEEHNHCRNAMHAEESILSHCAKNGISTNDGVLYITLYPCLRCIKLLIESGIKTVYYINDYKNDENIFSNKIKIIKMEE
jgi:dCMP deaminase